MNPLSFPVFLSFTFARPKVDEKRKKIVEQVTVLFMQYGIKSLTMDEIARNLGMSKKTLYQSFADKADLVETGIQAHMDKEAKSLQAIQEQSTNAIEEMFLLSQHVSVYLQQMHPSILFDLEKYYPAAYAKFNQYKTELIMASIARNIEQGIAQGLYRKNINIPIVAGLYVGRMDIIFDQQLFPNTHYNAKDVYFEAIRYHIRGIANENGIKLLREKFKTLDTQNPIF